jgi:thiosulfate reductase/polysulfide reductase chain A
MSQHDNDTRLRRRQFLRLGAALSAGTVLGCASQDTGSSGAKQGTGKSSASARPSREENLRVWKKNAGDPYRVGEVKMPGVCQLPGPFAKHRFPDPDKYKGAEPVHGMCQLCSTVCGITGWVKDGRILKVDGNPKDPNSRGRLCGRGQAALNHQYHHERLLYPLRRVGKRGEGKWKRISWEEAYTEISDRLRAVRESGQLEEFAFHQGRSRTKDMVGNFLKAFGTNTALNHRGLCSAARRAANLTYIFESDWDLGDYEKAKYILNFGSNMFEAHQGHVAGAQRIQRGRFENGAKLVTFDVRMSNTAGNSDEFYMPFPGTDGAVALGMAHTIVNEKLYDAEWFGEWANVSIEELREQLAEFTPQWAEQVSSVPKDVIVRIAREFAAAAPEAVTLCNRGSSAHINGYYNDRAIGLLNVLVGSVGQHGGWCWMWTGGIDKKRFAPPKGPSTPKTPSLLADPPEVALANVWNRMKVGEIVYHYLNQDRAKIQVYMSYNLDSPLTWPECDTTRNVLLDERKIGFHVCINPFLSETATFADIVLPWATYMERWDVDARGAYNLKPYISMRRPMVDPLGEAKDIREIFPELARRIGGGMEKWFPKERSTEEYMAEWVAKVPFDSSKYAGPMEFLEKEGAWEDPNEERYFVPYLRPLSTRDMEGADVDPESGIITKDGKGIGILHRGKPVRGFRTPSRKIEVRSVFVAKTGRNEDTAALTKLANSKGKNRPDYHRGNDVTIEEWPTYMQIAEHVDLDDDMLIMTSFKWNMHNHGRTANLKWCSEIVHSNPAWIHPETAQRLGLEDGDFIELTAYRSKTIDARTPALRLGHGEIPGRKLTLPVVITAGVHPKALAISNSLGHYAYTSVAVASRASIAGSASAGMDQEALHDDDWQRNMWWEDRSSGDPHKWVRNTGPGWAQNYAMPIAPDVISGQQAFNDTVVRVRKVT